MFIHYVITFWVSIRTSINAPLCLCSCFYVQVFVVNYTFEIFRNFDFWIDGYQSYPNFLLFYIYKTPKFGYVVCF